MPLNDLEKARLKEALHKMNNALNSISMQAELARMYAQQDDNEMIGEALGIIMSQCRQCSVITQSTHILLQED
jgi:hypothetical protein